MEPCNLITDPYVLGVATILGGIAAVWFFWDEITNTIRRWRKRDAPVGPRPLLVHTVDLREIDSTWGEKPLYFTEVVLVIENRGELIAENHVPTLVIEAGGIPLFDSPETLNQGRVVGETPPKTSITFSIYRLLQQPISKLCDLISLEGLYAILNREFTVKLHSTYTSPGGSPVYDSAIFTLKFYWFFDNDNCARVSAAIQAATYARYRDFPNNKIKTQIANAIGKYGRFIASMNTPLKESWNRMSRSFKPICTFNQEIVKTSRLKVFSALRHIVLYCQKKKDKLL